MNNEFGLNKGAVRVERVLGIYRQFKNNPLKVFMRKDFCISTKRIEPHLFLLLRLNLIEQVPVIYRTGKNLNIKRDVKGYRLRCKRN
jgi:hypothetical protein